MYTLANFNSHSIRSPRQNNKVRKASKRLQMEKEEVKKIFLTDIVLLYVENPKSAIENPARTNKLIKFQDTKLINKIKLLFYTLIMNYQKRNLRKPFCNSIKK
jgi:hypothetical protein